MKYPITHQMEQQTEKWYDIKSGKVSASNFSIAVGKPGVTRTKYMRKLIGELGSSGREESYINSAMQWGIDTEPEAREYYAAVNDCIVKEVGFIEYSDNIGVSPDGLVGEDGLLEIKCPNTATHIGYILDNKLPSTYKAQVQGQLWVSGRKWCDFVSYDPRYTKRPYWYIRVERDEKYIAEVEVKINKFVEEMKEKIDKITGTAF